MWTSISSERLLIHPIPINHSSVAAVMADWLNRPETVRYSGQRHKKHTMRSQKAYIKSFYGQPAMLRGIYRKDNQVMIGSITAYFDEHNGLANVGILIGFAKGQGFGREAWGAFCDRLFDQGIRKIEAGCMSVNKAMMAVCQGYQMVEEGRQFKHFSIDSYHCDLVHWGRFR